MGMSGSADSFPRFRGLDFLSLFVVAFVLRRFRSGGFEADPSSSDSLADWGTITSTVRALSTSTALLVDAASLEDLLMSFVDGGSSEEFKFVKYAG